MLTKLDAIQCPKCGRQINLDAEQGLGRATILDYKCGWAGYWVPDKERMTTLPFAYAAWPWQLDIYLQKEGRLDTLAEALQNTPRTHEDDQEGGLISEVDVSPILPQPPDNFDDDGRVSV